jgi:hypothetical protein
VKHWVTDLALGRIKLLIKIFIFFIFLSCRKIKIEKLKIKIILKGLQETVKILLGTSDAWSMSRLFQRIILKIVGFLKIAGFYISFIASAGD